VLQTAPQLPQLFVSLAVFTQLSVQGVVKGTLGHAAMHVLFVEQASVPFVGCATAHGTQLLLHCSVFWGQDVHIPFMHAWSMPLVPVAHALPQAPQLVDEVLISISHPLLGFLSQSANPALHPSIWHSDATQVSVAFSVLHA
jgi:hypothetical protein